MATSGGIMQYDWNMMQYDWVICGSDFSVMPTGDHGFSSSICLHKYKSIIATSCKAFLHKNVKTCSLNS